MPMPPNESFTRSQTVFLIDLMRHHIFNEGEGLPKTLHELNTRLKSAKGSNKLLWEDAAEQLSSQFTESFLPSKVHRKWHTLLEGYTKARDSMRNRGKETTRFKFYSEMDALLKDVDEEEHDVIFPVVVTPDGRGLRISPSQASRSSSVKALAKTAYRTPYGAPHRRSTAYTSPLRTHYSTAFVQASPVVQVKENESFNKDQTLFLIDLMRQLVITEGEGLPKTLEELNGRLKSAKKRLWEDAAEQLSSHFLEYFNPDVVARKWSSLVQGYKNVRDRDRITGQRNSMRFQFYSDIDELLEVQHDEAPPVVVTTERQREPKPEALGPSSNDSAVADSNTTTGSCQENTEATFNQENTDAPLSQSEPPIPTFSQSDSPIPTFSQSEPPIPTFNQSVSLEVHESFSRDQSLFLIDLMRQHIENQGRGPPRTFKELNKRLSTFKGSKQQLWKDAAEKLSVHFRKYFCPRRVTRKWYTLVEGYSKVRENMKTRGKDATRFHFYSEMDALLVEEDESFPVVKTPERREVVGPVLRGRRSRVRAFSDAADDPSPPGTPTPPSHKRRREEDQLLHFLREAEKATQRRHNETLTHLKSIQSLMTKLLDKL
ncbi:uncharacterized protein LOC134088416 isoform X2 [Sardina pilchardus]